MILTIHEAAAAMRRGELTPSELLEQCLARIDVYEPAVKAWVVVDREGARDQAERLTSEAKRGEWRGPLHGIPVGVKDIIDVFDLPTGCGSKLWANSVARQDATCVRRLRQAGAVILGKTVTTAYAYLDPPVTRNPWNLERTPGGSSSGSAAAVACGMCLAALGTQTVGSLTRPASYCGVCSLKPDYDHVSRRGVLPLAPTLDHVGAMARSVIDLAYLADVLCGQWGCRDEDDSVGLACREAVAKILTPGDIGPEHFYRMGGDFEARADPAMRAAMDRLQVTMRRDATFDHRHMPLGYTDMPRQLRTILATEAAIVHGERLRRHPEDYPPRIRELVDEGSRLLAVDYETARLHRDDMAETVNDMIWNLGQIVTPATTGPVPDRSTTGDAVYNAPWSYTGLPTVSFPIGRSDDGMPLAAQLVGKKRELPRLLASAAWLEREVNYDIGLPPIPQ